MEELLFRPYAWHGESLISYLHRAANLNGCVLNSNFLKLIQAKLRASTNNEFSVQEIKMTAKITQIQERELLQMTASKFGMTLDAVNYHRIIQKNKVKYCQLCIQEKLYHRAAWCYHPVTICVNHAVKLLDLCQKCHRKITIHQLMDGVCKHCGFLYRLAKVETINQDSTLYHSQKWIQALLLDESNPREGESSLNYHLKLAYASSFLLEGLHSFTEEMGTLQFFHNRKNGLKDNAKNALQYANVFWMYQNFPYHFFQVLREFNKKNHDVKYMQKVQFETLISGDTFRKVREAYNQFCLEQLDKGYVRHDCSVFKNERDLLKLRKYVSKEELKQTTGLTYKMIDRLAQGVDRKHVIKGKVTWKKINETDFQKALTEKNKLITRQQAAEYLGLERGYIPELVKAGYLHFNTKLDKRGLIFKKDVHQILRECGCRCTVDLEGKISFTQALQKYNHLGLSIVKLIRFMQARQLRPLSSRSTAVLGDFYFDGYELENCVLLLKEEKQREAGYNMTQVISKLRIGEKTMHQFIVHRILVPCKILTLKDGRKHFYFDQSSVEDFLRNNLTIPIASITFGISQQRLRRWIKEGKLTDKSKGYARQYWLDVSELRNLVSDTN